MENSLENLVTPRITWIDSDVYIFIFFDVKLVTVLNCIESEIGKLQLLNLLALLLCYSLKNKL